MPLTITIERSNKPDKKYLATVNNKHIHFGNSKYHDYTIHKDNDRKERYIARHKAREDYTKQGVATPGHLSRFILWNEPTIQQNINKLNKKYTDIKFKLKQKLTK